MGSEDSTDWCSEVMNDFQNFPYCSIFITTTKLGDTGLNLMAANQVVILQKPCVLKKQQQAMKLIGRPGKLCNAHTWQFDTCPYGFGDRVTPLHMVNGTIQLPVLHRRMNHLMISKEEVHNIFKTHIEVSAIQAGILLQLE